MRMNAAVADEAGRVTGERPRSASFSPDRPGAGRFTPGHGEPIEAASARRRSHASLHTEVGGTA